MPESTMPRRSSRAAPAAMRYRALVTIVYPATEAAARARLAGERVDHDWEKARPGDLVPDWLVDVSPSLLAKGRVEIVQGEE